jgi:hypothetical protein
MGVAETSKESSDNKAQAAEKLADKGGEKSAEKSPDKPDAPASKGNAKKLSSECLASEEVIGDLEAREKKLVERESALKEKEKELASQQNAIKEELAKLDGKRSEEQVTRQKELTAREEQVNKLMETFEGMSPKAAAQVLGGVEDELAVMTLSRLSSLKAGKILGNLKADKSARLSEMMAYGKASKRKESVRGESNDRAPASAQ